MGPYKCNTCTYSSLTLRQPKIHKLSHTGEKPYKCNICLLSFITLYQLNRHKLIHTSERRLMIVAHAIIVVLI